jgi:hypothetical protein
VLFLRGCRAQNGLADRPFDIVIGGMSPGGAAGRDLAGPLADLGVTWWDERMPWVMTWNVPSRSCAGSTKAHLGYSRASSFVSSPSGLGSSAPGLLVSLPRTV